MSNFICPVCKKALIKNDRSYTCPDNHCFDISRKGTVNLLLSQKSRHGDDKLMVNARRDFLNKGYYLPLLEQLCVTINEIAENGNTIIDCGCGECWYTDGIYRHLKENGKIIDLIGIDVSKEAVLSGASRNRELSLAVGTVFDIPVMDKSCDIAVSLFAPFAPDEYKRVLKDNGYFVTAFPLEEHLWELKKAVYEKPYKNEVADMDIDGFELIITNDIKTEITLDSTADIESLFTMTPYYYKTSQTDKAKLSALSSLTTKIQFRTAVYRLL